ncbi:sulfotransferase domain-containing protein [Mesobacterium pallidum]|uniref:sulfotransferase domain-containing protein n=1 Tax=Mesobacterium pallidum TaxID=2872037 RepID=UPI001EE24E58|nr:sulfotransferase domain-containing protein [Mesobacterium pallidum]
MSADSTAEKPKAEENPNLQTVKLPIEGGSLNFRIDTKAEGNAFFCMGVRKSGSTMLGIIAQFLARRNGINIVDLPGTAFKRGFVVGHWENSDINKIIYPGNFYGGFRNYVPGLGMSPHFAAAPKLFMFRDPRDALVSQYFSDAYSHSLPPEGAGVGREIFLEKRKAAQETKLDDYVVQKAGGMANTMMGYTPLLDDPKCLVLRYEEWVFQKKRMIHKILDHFGWECHPGQIENILKQVDVVPEAEDGQKFIRKAVPGDHRAKLDPATIRKLDAKLKEVLEIFDYY